MTIIPTTEQCIKLLDEFNVPKNIKEHSFAVNRISISIAKKLKQAGVDIDLDLVNAASLLHDIDKIATLEEIEQHGEKGYKWLAERQHKKVGEIIRIKSEIIREGRTIVHASSNIFNGDDKLIAVGQSDLLKTQINRDYIKDLKH